VHWGVFDFKQPNFVGRFVLGRMQYSTGEDLAGPMVDDYIANDRDVIVQELNLSPPQKRALLALLREKLKPDNRDYLYEYYRSNCSTKLRDALDAPGVLNGSLQQQLSAVPTRTTYRWHTRI